MKHISSRFAILLFSISAIAIVLTVFPAAAGAPGTTYSYYGTFIYRETYSYPIALNAGDYVVARELCEETDPGNNDRPIDPYISVYDPASTMIASSDDGYLPRCNSFSSSCVEFTASTTGSYTFIADQAASNGGPYSLHIYVNDSSKICPQPPYFTSDYGVMTGVNQPFTYTFEAMGRPTPTITYSDENLPPGVTRDGDTLSGTPTQVGQYSITATASNGEGADAVMTLEIEVAESPIITSSSYVLATVGTPFTHTFTAVGDPAPTLYYGFENLPPGVVRIENTLTGTPTQTGTYSITVAAMNGIEPDAIQTLTIVVGEIPTPPPAPQAEDVNFDSGSVARTGIPESLVDSIYIRELYQNGAPTQWLGGDQYNAGSIGIQGILDLGIRQAIDIFSPNGLTYFYNGAVFCLRGEGSLIWLAASGVPRHAEIIGSYTVPEFPGYTCATLFEPGTLVLVDPIVP